MFKRLITWLDPIILIGLIVSISTSVIMVWTGNDTISGLTIGLLSTIVTLLIDIIARVQKAEIATSLGNREFEISLGKGIERIITSLQGVNVQLLEKREDAYLYLEKRIQQAKQSIDVTHSTPPTHKSHISNETYYKALSESVKINKVRLRRVLVASTPDHVEWVKDMINDFIGHPFFIGYYPKPSHYMPMIDFFIIDEEEVIMAGGERSLSYDIKTVVIKHPAFVKMLQEHFDTLWRNSIRLNEKGVRQDLLEQMELLLK